MFGYPKDANELPFDDGEQNDESDASAWVEQDKMSFCTICWVCHVLVTGSKNAAKHRSHIFSSEATFHTDF